MPVPQTIVGTSGHPALWKIYEHVEWLCGEVLQEQGPTNNYVPCGWGSHPATTLEIF